MAAPLRADEGVMEEATFQAFLKLKVEQPTPAAAAPRAAPELRAEAPPLKRLELRVGEGARCVKGGKGREGVRLRQNDQKEFNIRFVGFGPKEILNVRWLNRLPRAYDSDFSVTSLQRKNLVWSHSALSHHGLPNMLTG